MVLECVDCAFGGILLVDVWWYQLVGASIGYNSCVVRGAGFIDEYVDVHGLPACKKLYHDGVVCRDLVGI